jgi:hypothetical protein
LKAWVTLTTSVSWRAANSFICIYYVWALLQTKWKQESNHFVEILKVAGCSLSQIDKN